MLREGAVQEAAPRADGTRRRPDRRRALQAVVLGAPVAFIVVLGWTHRWMTEDGFIYLRIVRNLVSGDGPVFNAGERVEAFTGTLWVGILAVADLVLPARLEWISIVVGLASTAAGVALAMAGARRLLPAGHDRFVVPLGVVVFVALFPVWAYATSGLETGLVFTWLGGCCWILGGWAGRGTRVSAPQAAVLGLGWLVRPELVLFSALFLLVVAAGQWPRESWAQRGRFAAAALGLPVAYQLFRMGYFASLVTNTAIAKEGSDVNLERGWRYLRDVVGPYRLWVPALGLVLGGYVPALRATAALGRRRRRAVLAAFALGGAGNAAYVVAVGGDYHHARMLLPALFALCAPVAVVPLARRHAAGLLVAAWAVVAVVALRPVQHGDDPFANGILAPRHFGDVTVADYTWAPGGAARRWYSGPAFYHEAGIYAYRRADVELRPDLGLPYGAMWGIGVSGYAMGPDFHVLDLMGLADWLAAHLETAPPLDPATPRFPGHEKPIPGPWVAARVTAPGSEPDAAAFPPFGNPLIAPTTGAAFVEQVAWARAALRCDDLAELERSVTAPLTPRRFAENVLRSFDQTWLRIPADPEEAHRRFCGPGTPPEVAALARRG